MNIEQKIDKMLKEKPCIYPRGVNSVEFNRWYGLPLSNQDIRLKIDRHVDEVIKCADLAECLTSPYIYIRECKKWYIENKGDI